MMMVFLVLLIKCELLDKGLGKMEKFVTILVYFW